LKGHNNKKLAVVSLMNFKRPFVAALQLSVTIWQSPSVLAASLV